MTSKLQKKTART